MTSSLSRVEIQRRVDELGPWVHAFEYDGFRYFDSGERPVLWNDHGQLKSPRTLRFYDVFPDARRVLELGCLEAADTVPLASRTGAEVVAIEGREENLRRAEFVLGLHGLKNVRLVLADAETLNLSEFGRFDAVMCSGILYHLARPWDLVASIATVTDNVFLSTHYWGGEDDGTMIERAGYQLKEVQETFAEPRLRGLTPASLWFGRSSLFEALADSGFTKVEVLTDEGDGPVRVITLAVRR